MTYKEYMEKAEYWLDRAGTTSGPGMIERYLGFAAAWLEMAKQASRQEAAFDIDDLRFASLRQQLLGDHG